VFIPAIVWESKELIPAEKMLLGEIMALSERRGYCSASRAHFAEWLNCSPQNVTYFFSKLERLGYLSIARVPGERLKMVVNKAKFYGTEGVNPIDGGGKPDLRVGVNGIDGGGKWDLPEIQYKENNKNKYKELAENEFPQPQPLFSQSPKKEKIPPPVAPALPADKQGIRKQCSHSVGGNTGFL